MKGVVFTEFLSFVEEKFSYDVVDNIINNSELESKGVYTAVGYYDHKEMNQLVSNLSKEVNLPMATLLNVFGEHLFGILAKAYPALLNAKNLIDFLSSIDNYIHPEVYKLYPDAELPKFSIGNKSEDYIELIYSSERHYQELALGLLKGASNHFNAQTEITMSSMDNNSTLFKVQVING